MGNCSFCCGVCHHQCIVYYMLFMHVSIHIGQVYIDAVVSFMHEGMKCLVNMVMN